ncbi:hypothetical protein ACIQVE_29675, partial [Pseudomonas sp. NPDC098747]|uniref:hypothetical protein n=1 Tax=Pseudomonas sp. NPDC098747 TaxID=3364487 RepID=UPI00383A8BF6
MLTEEILNAQRQVRTDAYQMSIGEIVGMYCSGLMKPDTHLGENARQIEVSDDQTTPFLFR